MCVYIIRFMTQLLIMYVMVRYIFIDIFHHNWPFVISSISIKKCYFSPMNRQSNASTAPILNRLFFLSADVHELLKLLNTTARLFAACLHNVLHHHALSAGWDQIVFFSTAPFVLTLASLFTKDCVLFLIRVAYYASWIFFMPWHWEDNHPLPKPVNIIKKMIENSFLYTLPNLQNNYQ